LAFIGNRSVWAFSAQRRKAVSILFSPLSHPGFPGTLYLAGWHIERPSKAFRGEIYPNCGMERAGHHLVNDKSTETFALGRLNGRAATLSPLQSKAFRDAISSSEFPLKQDIAPGYR
jgi:hypothetical protein